MTGLSKQDADSPAICTPGAGRGPGRISADSRPGQTIDTPQNPLSHVPSEAGNLELALSTGPPFPPTVLQLRLQEELASFKEELRDMK